MAALILESSDIYSIYTAFTVNIKYRFIFMFIFIKLIQTFKMYQKTVSVTPNRKSIEFFNK